jgi:hypothetical protein
VTSFASHPRPQAATIAVPVWQLAKVSNLEEREVGGEAGRELAD